MLNLQVLQQDIRKRADRLAVSEAENKKARAQLEVDKAALAVVLEMENRLNGAAPSDPEADVEIPGANSVLLSLKEAVEKAIYSVGPAKHSFSSGDIDRHLATVFTADKLAFDLEKNRPNISRYLNTFSESGLLAIAKKGSGRRPTTYRLKGETAAEVG